MANNASAKEAAASPAAHRPSGRGWLMHRFLRWREASISIVAILLIVYFQVSNSNFLGQYNILTLTQFISAPAIIACGEIMLLICGEIDLSAGQVFALTPFVMAIPLEAGLPLILCLILGLLAAAAVGLVNGLVTVVLRVPSFVTTLGTLFLINGLTLTISGGFPTNAPEGGIIAMLLGSGYSGIIWALLIVAVMHVLLRHRRWGLHTIAVGGNITAAAEAGINVALIKIGNFVLTSVLAGLTGLLVAFRIGSIDPLAGGTEIMFLAVAAGVIGGTSLAGGSGTIVGGLIGAIVLGVLQDGFTLQGINAFTFDMIIGAAILIAMVANVHLTRLRAGGRS
jgi:simple sugar transport system permease protein